MKFIISSIFILFYLTFSTTSYPNNYIIIVIISICPLLYYLIINQKINYLFILLVSFLILRLLLLLNYNDQGADDIALSAVFNEDLRDIANTDFIQKYLAGEIYYYPITIYYVAIPKLYWVFTNEAVLAFNFLHVIIFAAITAYAFRLLEVKKRSKVLLIILLNPIFLLVTSNLNRDIYIFIGLMLLVVYLTEQRWTVKFFSILVSSCLFFLARIEFLFLIPLILVIDYLSLSKKQMKFFLISSVAGLLALTLFTEHTIFYLIVNIIKSIISPFPWYDQEALSAVTNNYGNMGIPFLIIGSIFNLFIFLLFFYLVNIYYDLGVIDKKLLILAVALLLTLVFGSLAFNRYLLPSILIMSIVVINNIKLLNRSVIRITAILAISLPLFLNMVWFIIRGY